MDTTSYIIEVNHHYDGKGRGGAASPNMETAAKPKNENIGLVDTSKSEKKFMKQATLMTAAVGYSAIKNVGSYTGDYGLSRGVGNIVKVAGIAASFTNPYTAAMAMIGVTNGIVGYVVKKRDSDYKADMLKQVSGGINNGIRGRKL